MRPPSVPFSALVICATFLIPLSSSARDSATPYDPSTYFQSDPVPENVAPVGNPLDWAGDKIGLDSVDSFWPIPTSSLNHGRAAPKMFASVLPATRVASSV